MNRITSQTSFQAAKVIHDASQFEDVQITVSWSGDVREANALERVIYGVIDFFDAGAPEKRRDEAREAVKTKLTNEISFLVGPSSGVGSAALPNEMTEAIDQVAGKLIDGGPISKKGIPDGLGDALQNIKDITAETNKKSRKLIWKAVAEQRNENKKVSIDTAKNIAQNTKIWKESLSISTRDAFRLASNAWNLYESKKIPLEDGKEILLCSGRLINRHGFKKKDALNYAIDLRAPLNALGLGLDSVERVMKYLDHAIPELRKQSERLRISAAIRYLQLQDARYKDVQPIDEIRRSLDDLPRLQQAMPKGCVIDQIHQGSHLRGKASLTRAHCQELEPKIATLTKEGLYSKSSNGRYEVNFPDIFDNFDHHHVIDLTRGLKIELRTNDSIDQSFAKLENKRRQNPKSLSEQEFQQWAELRTSWAGSSEAARAISHLQSQTLFGEVEIATGKNLRNESGYMCKDMGDPALLSTSYAANRTTRDTREVFELSAVRYVNASMLVAQPAAEQQDELLPKPQLNFPLLPNPGDGIQANPSVFSVKRECVLEADASDLAKGSTDCRVIAVTEEWDILFDWDTWIEKRTSIGAI